MSYGDRSWENVWHVDIGINTDVPPDLILAFETFHLDTLLDLFTLQRIVRRPFPSTDEFIEVLVGTVGANAVGAAHVLPLWNTVRMLLQGGSGRPGVKFIRGFLTDAMLSDEANHITPAILTALEGHLNDLLNAGTAAGCTFVFGADDRPVASGITQSAIQMRQQHRKRRRSV